MAARAVVARLLHRIRIDPARGGERLRRLPFLAHGPVEIELRKPVTFPIGENGSGRRRCWRRLRPAAPFARAAAAAMPRRRMSARRRRFLRPSR